MTAAVATNSTEITTNFDHACGVYLCGPNYILIVEPLAVSFVVAVIVAVVITTYNKIHQ